MPVARVEDRVHRFALEGAEFGENPTRGEERHEAGVS